MKKIILISQKYLFLGYSKWRFIKQSAPGLNSDAYGEKCFIG